MAFNAVNPISADGAGQVPVSLPREMWIAPLTDCQSGSQSKVPWKPQTLEMLQAARSIALNLFTTDLPGEAAAPDLRHQFTLQRSQTSAEAVEH